MKYIFYLPLKLKKGVYERFSDDFLTDDQKGNQESKADRLWEEIFKAFEHKSLIGSSINSSNSITVSHGETDNGLLIDHAYLVLSAIEIVSNGSQFDELVNNFRDKRTSNDVRLIKLGNTRGLNFLIKFKFNILIYFVFQIK